MASVEACARCAVEKASPTKISPSLARAWAKPVSLGFELPPVKQTLGRALVAVPLEIERVAPGKSVTIPAAFLPVRVVQSRFGTITPIYNERTRQWTQTSQPGTPALSFQVPPAALPLKVTEANFTADGGRGTVDVFGDPRSTGCAIGCPWTAAPQASWIHIVSGSPGAGDDRFTYQVDANPGNQPRVGQILVEHRIITIRQAGR